MNADFLEGSVMMSAMSAVHQKDKMGSWGE